MAEVILKNIKKVYPHQDGKKKKKKGAEERRSNLTVTDEGVLAVHDFNLSIKDKEFIVLVGPSGCGKSTTLRMVAGLEEISGGELYIDGTLVNDVAPKDRDIAMVFQNYALYPHMTVAENMAFPLKLRKVPKEEIAQRVAQAANILGITEYLDRKPKALSGGQRQRVAIGRAIVREPKVLLKDLNSRKSDIASLFFLLIGIYICNKPLHSRHGYSLILLSLSSYICTHSINRIFSKNNNYSYFSLDKFFLCV